MISGEYRRCKACGVPFRLTRRRKSYCSRSCAPVRSHKGDRRYSSSTWRKTVIAIKRRDGFRCQACGATERLVVDHKTPHDRYPGSFYDPANLWVLCMSDNNAKRDLTVAEWIAARERRGQPARAMSTGDYSTSGRPSLYSIGRTRP